MRFAPRSLFSRLVLVQLSVLGCTMLLLPFTQGHYALLATALVVWGIAGFGMMTPQQSRLAVLAPAQAPILLSLNTSMLYVGTAVGAAIGGAVSGTVGFANMGWAGAPFAFAGLLVLLMSPRNPGLLQASAARAPATMRPPA